MSKLWIQDPNWRPTLYFDVMLLAMSKVITNFSPVRSMAIDVCLLLYCWQMFSNINEGPQLNWAIRTQTNWLSESKNCLRTRPNGSLRKIKYFIAAIKQANSTIPSVVRFVYEQFNKCLMCSIEQVQ